MTVEQVFESAVLTLTVHFPCLRRQAVISGIRADLPRGLPKDREEAWPQMLALVAKVAAQYEADAERRTPDAVTQSFQELRECHDILLKTARRCARDLRHAVDHVGDTELRPLFTERIQLYETVFADLTAYRLELHRQIENLEEDQQRSYKDYAAAFEIIKQLRAQIEELQRGVTCNSNA